MVSRLQSPTGPKDSLSGSVTPLETKHSMLYRACSPRNHKFWMLLFLCMGNVLGGSGRTQEQG